jgi:hypothetical protein
VSPTVFRWKGYRFNFFSREETRPHVHVYCSEGEAKLRLEPEVSVAKHHGLPERQLAEIRTVAEDRKHEIIDAWNRHFRR